MPGCPPHLTTPAWRRPDRSGCGERATGVTAVFDLVFSIKRSRLALALRAPVCGPPYQRTAPARSRRASTRLVAHDPGVALPKSQRLRKTDIGKFCEIGSRATGPWRTASETPRKCHYNTHIQPSPTGTPRRAGVHGRKIIRPTRTPRGPHADPTRTPHADPHADPRGPPRGPHADPTRIIISLPPPCQDPIHHTRTP